MAAPRKKPPAKRPAKDLKPGDMRSQALNKGKPQPAADLKKTDTRASYLKKAKPYQPAPRAPRYPKAIGPQKPAYDKPIGPERPAASSSSKAGYLLRGAAKRVLPVVGFMADASPAQAPAPAKGEKLMKGMPSVGFGGPTSSAAYGYKGRKMGGGPRINKSAAYTSMAKANNASLALAASEKRKAGGARPDKTGPGYPAAKTKTPKVNQFEIAKGNKAAKTNAPVKKEASQQVQPEKKKGIFGKFKLSARGKRPQTRFQRDM